MTLVPISISNLPRVIIGEIALYVPEEISGLNCTIEKASNQAFSDLQKTYQYIPLIANFMPAHLSTKATVLQTVKDIFHYGRMTSQTVFENFCSNNLLSILENGKNFLELQNCSIAFFEDQATDALERRDLTTIRVLSIIGYLSDESCSVPLLTNINLRGLYAQRAANGDPKILQMFLASGPISHTQKRLIGINAIACKNLSCLQELFRRRYLNEENIKNLLQKAVFNGDEEIVRFLTTKIEIGKIFTFVVAIKAFSKYQSKTATVLIASQCHPLETAFGARKVADLSIKCFQYFRKKYT